MLLIVQIESHLRPTCIVPHYIKEIAIDIGPLVLPRLDGVKVSESIHRVEFLLALWSRMCTFLDILYPVYFGGMSLWHSVSYYHVELAYEKGRLGPDRDCL